jgi:hypothetical protein
MWLRAILGLGMLAGLAGDADAQALYKRVYGDPKCRETYYTGMVPSQYQFVGGFMMWIEVPEWRRLSEPAFRQQVLEAAFQENLEYCRARNQRAAIAVVALMIPGRQGSIMTAWTSAEDRSWRISSDRVAATIAEIEAAEERRRAQIEQQRRREEAARRAEEERQKAEAEIVAKLQARTAELAKAAEEDARERDSKRPAESFCVFSCDPTEQNARLALQNRLGAVIRAPVIVLKFRKTNGLRAKVMGVDTYELHFSADIELPQGFLPRPKGFWDEMQRGADGMLIATELKELMSFRVTSADSKKWWDPHSLTATGRVLFRKTEQGWEGYDGMVYAK